MTMRTVMTPFTPGDRVIWLHSPGRSFLTGYSVEQIPEGQICDGGSGKRDSWRDAMIRVVINGSRLRNLISALAMHCQKARLAIATDLFVTHFKTFSCIRSVA